MTYPKWFFRRKRGEKLLEQGTLARYMVEDWGTAWCTKKRLAGEGAETMEYLPKAEYERVYYSQMAGEWKAYAAV